MTTEMNYLEKFLKHLRGSFIWSSALSLIFFLIYMPILPTSQYWLSFKISTSYSLSIFFYVTLIYGFFYFFLHKREKKYKMQLEIPVYAHFLMTAVAVTLGIVQATYIKYFLLGSYARYEEIVFSALMGCFIGAMFIFKGLYKTSKETNSELKKANTEAELHALKNQMQPHFLFNSLNSLLSLIETNNQGASVAAQNLSDLYREILENSKHNVVTLKSEKSIIDKYLFLEKIRFGERLEYSVNFPENSESIYIPPLILQTLVENSVKHGISKKIKNGSVEVSIAEKHDGWLAEVKNTGELENKNHFGTGISNSVSRLKLLYGSKSNFSLLQTDDCVSAQFWFSGTKLP
jgi:sensor histidine kinase YesM